MPPPPPQTVDELRRTAAILSGELRELLALYRVTQDPEVLDGLATLSCSYDRVLLQLGRALDRERPPPPPSPPYGASFDL